MKNYKNWIELYERRAAISNDIRDASGYNHPLAQLTEQGLDFLVDRITKVLGLAPADRMLDLGCGVGLITEHLIDKTDLVVGLDANINMLNLASRNVREKTILIVGMADELPFLDKTFDKILSHSVFQLFPSLKYAEKVLSEIKRVLKKGGKCLIMDVCDIEKKEQYLKVKNLEQHNLQRLFYDRKWFTNRIPEAKILDLEVPSYKNSKYRFSVLIS